VKNPSKSSKSSKSNVEKGEYRDEFDSCSSGRNLNQFMNIMVSVQVYMLVKAVGISRWDKNQ